MAGVDNGSEDDDDDDDENFIEMDSISGDEAGQDQDDFDALSMLTLHFTSNLFILLYFYLVVPHRHWGPEMEGERREAATEGLLSLLSIPPAASHTDNRLEVEIEAEESRRIAARFDQQARQRNMRTDKNQDNHETGGSEDIFEQLSLAMTVHDAPLWRVRVRVSHCYLNLCNWSFTF